MSVRRLTSLFHLSARGTPLTFPLGALSLGALLMLQGCDQLGGGTADATAGSAESADTVAAASAGPETAAGKVSYSAGYQIAEQFAQQFGEDFQGDAFEQGVADAVAGDARLVDQAAFAAARTELMTRRQAEMERISSENIAAAEAFLAENGVREGITTTASGLQYEVLKAGEGDAPAGPESTVVTHYTGRLLDGTVFDSSEARGQPATFGLSNVIPGWTEALQLMHVGDRWRIWLPPELAYGARPPSPEIPANALLEFEVELLEVDPEAG